MKGGREKYSEAGFFENRRETAPSRVIFDPGANVKHELGLNTDESGSDEGRCDSIVPRS